MFTPTKRLFVLCVCVGVFSSPAHTGSPVTFTLHTRRSQGGQWQAEVDIQHGETVRDLVLTHYSHSCEGVGTTVRSKTVITAEEQRDVNGAPGHIERYACDNTTEKPCFGLRSASVSFACGSSSCSGPVPPGTTALMACKPGYTRGNSAPAEITCLGTGDWSGPELLCVREPVGYELFPTLGWYQLYVVGNTFQQAKRICEFDGGNLGIVNSPGELEALQQLINKSRPAVNIEHQHDIYMGVRRHGEQEYVDLQGRPMTASYYFRWCKGRPPTVSQYGDCTVYTNHMKCHWDSACNRKLPFLCEIPLVGQEK